jgi:hypothetical protein
MASTRATVVAVATTPHAAGPQRCSASPSAPSPPTATSASSSRTTAAASAAPAISPARTRREVSAMEEAAMLPG